MRERGTEGPRDGGVKERRKNSLALGVVSNWASHVVFVVSGFVLPRMIDREAGQEALGVWDFAWSLMAYTGLFSLGIASAVGRYVARFAKLKDDASLNRMYSASVILLNAGFVIGLGFVGVVYALTPRLVGTKDPALVALALQLTAILGVAAAVQLPLSAYSGALSGLQRFELRTIIRIGVSAVSLGMMIVLLVGGAGLEWVAGTFLFSELGIGVLNWMAVRRECPRLRFAPGLVDGAAIKDALGLGSKTALQGLSRMGLYQTSGLIVSGFLGPGALAVYSRQRALTAFMSKLMATYGNVFAPEASVLEAKEDLEGLRALVIKSSRFGFAISLPLVAAFCLCGSAVLQIWMGPGYEAPLVLTLMMLGHLMSYAQRGTYNILVGLNRHGRSALWELGATAGSVMLGLLFVGVLGWGTWGAALAVGLAVTCGGGLAPSVISCRHLGMNYAVYLRQVLPVPLLASLPWVAALAGARWFFPEQAYAQLGAGVGVGAMVTIPIYWRHILTDSLRQRVRGRFRRWIGGAGVPKAST